MQHSFFHLFRFSLGLILIMFGIVGLLLPIFQSAILIVIGLPLVSPHHGKQFLHWIKNKFVTPRR